MNTLSSWLNSYSIVWLFIKQLMSKFIMMKNQYVIGSSCLKSMFWNIFLVNYSDILLSLLAYVFIPCCRHLNESCPKHLLSSCVKICDIWYKSISSMKSFMIISKIDMYKLSDGSFYIFTLLLWNSAYCQLLSSWSIFSSVYLSSSKSLSTKHHMHWFGANIQYLEIP